MNSLINNDIPFDIVLTNSHLLDMTGEKLTKTVINSEKEAPKFILLTSSGTRNNSKHFLNTGFFGYMSKPVDPSILFDILMMVLDSVKNNKALPEIISQYTIKQSKTKNELNNRTLPTSISLRVLLAEDNLVNQKVATKLLQKLNCTVDIAANGKEAVNMDKQFPYQLIFMDCQMPEMDGYEATGEIKHYLNQQNTNIPIIAMTANAIKGDKEKCLAAGMDDYLSKPINKIKLGKMINHWSDPVQQGKIAS